MAEPGMPLASVAGTPVMGIDENGNAQHMRVTASGALDLGGAAFTVVTAPAVEATPDYADGDVIGGLQEIANAARVAGGGGKVVSASVYSKVDIGANIPIRVLLFNAEPAASTFTENSAPSIHADDLDKLVGTLDLSQRLDLGTPVVLFASNPRVPFALAGVGTSLWAVAIAGGVINLGSTSDLQFTYGIERD